MLLSLPSLSHIRKLLPPTPHLLFPVLVFHKQKKKQHEKFSYIGLGWNQLHVTHIPRLRKRERIASKHTGCLRISALSNFPTPAPFLWCDGMALVLKMARSQRLRRRVWSPVECRSISAKVKDPHHLGTSRDEFREITFEEVSTGQSKHFKLFRLF